MNYSIEEIEGIGPAYGKKLLAAGVKTTGQLLKRGATPAGRKELESASGIAHALILKWCNLADLMRVTAGRTDPELSKVLVSNSKDAVFWAHDHGKVPMEPARTIAGVEVNGVVIWPKGAIVRAEHEGVGLSAAWFKAAERDGVEIRYEASGRDLIQDKKGRVVGVTVQEKGKLHEITANAVILACGGFEANAQWRAQYLGRPWDHAKVRGTRYNQGDGLRMAMAIGAMPCGQWSGRHRPAMSTASHASLA